MTAAEYDAIFERTTAALEEAPTVGRLALAELLDACEAAQLASCDVPAEDVPEGLRFALYALGRAVDEARPGLADRLTDRILERAQENR